MNRKEFALRIEKKLHFRNVEADHSYQISAWLNKEPIPKKHFDNIAGFITEISDNHPEYEALTTKASVVFSLLKEQYQAQRPERRKLDGQAQYLLDEALCESYDDLRSNKRRAAWKQLVDQNYKQFEETDKRFDLSGMVFERPIRGISFEGCNPRGAGFSQVKRFQNVNFNEADLSGVNCGDIHSFDNCNMDDSFLVPYDQDGERRPQKDVVSDLEDLLAAVRESWQDQNTAINQAFFANRAGKRSSHQRG